jgi:hypothetical protein
MLIIIFISKILFVYIIQLQIHAQKSKITSHIIAKFGPPDNDSIFLNLNNRPIVSHHRNPEPVWYDLFR